MTGHHHEPFDDASRPAGAPGGNDRSHLHMWIAAIVTLLVIVGFWIFLLPMQFEGSGESLDAEAERLRTIQQSGYQATMRARLDSMGRALESAMQATQEEAAPEPAAEEAPADTVMTDEVHELQERLEEEQR